jgi:hypothetical protein
MARTPLKYPYFRDAPKSKDNRRSSPQSIFVEDPHYHPAHKDSDSLFFPLNALIAESRMLTNTGGISSFAGFLDIIVISAHFMKRYGI